MLQVLLKNNGATDVDMAENGLEAIEVTLADLAGRSAEIRYHIHGQFDAYDGTVYF